ncbi:MAG: hypothetical protein JRI53_09030 [Deltaproteobacteria bacterium]|nr:hypothetical protein [Deltaproteobacteria bacterium]MBW1984852.1 hypothetical protein [Deltaproteobacteria bacterium]MBW2180702.1 hypothetical protein [Deltaproteobacteria bacterium]
MTEKLVLYDDMKVNIEEGQKRRMAVETALELIRADVMGNMGGHSTAGTFLDAHLSKLSVYADQIQDALKVK